MVVDIARVEWRTNCSTIDVVAIGFGGGGSTGMKFQGHFYRCQNTYGAREHIIQRADQIGYGNRRFNDHAGRLRQRMDASVGSAGALWQGFFTGEEFESVHQRPFNGQLVRLNLPSGEVVAIVSQREFEISR